MTTDHVRIWVNNSQVLGLVVKPYTYRVNFSPTFFPRFSVGDMRGIDQARWRSWIQSRFDEGEGQLLWSSAMATNRYAMGHLVEVGRPMTSAYRNDYQPGNIPVNSGGALNRDDSVVGDISAALFPQAMSLGSLDAAAAYFTNQFPIHTVEWSGRPMIWHWKTAWVYTNVQEPDAWIEGAALSNASKLTGMWAKAWEHSDTAKDFHISSAIIYSQITHISLTGALAASDIALWAYGTVHTLGTTAATMYAPVFNTSLVHVTKADRIAAYDEKLWRAEGGKVFYLEPSAGTTQAYWSEPYVPGDPGVEILNMREFNGRLYFGKQNALWTYDAGRLYRVEDFSAYTDKWNFSHMTVHRGYMYFNIRHMLFRLSTAGTLEQIQTYPAGGIITSAASVGDKLYYLARNPGAQPNTDVWVFDPETGGNFRLVNASGMSKADWGSPRSLGASQGLLLIAPMIISRMNMSETMPITVLDPITPAKQQSFPGYADGTSYEKSWFATSMLDFGLPTLNKAFRAVTIDYELNHQEQDYIDVYYLTALKQHNAILNSFEHDERGDPPTTPPDTTLIDGNLATGRTFRFGMSGWYNSQKYYPLWALGVKSDPTLGTTPHVRRDLSRIRWIAKSNPPLIPNRRFLERYLSLRYYTDQGLAPYIPHGWATVTGNLDLRASYTQAAAPDNGYYLIIDAVIPPQTLDSMRLQPTYTSELNAGAYTDTVGLQVWLGLNVDSTRFGDDFQALDVDIPSVTKQTPVEEQDWTYLGRVGGSSALLWDEITRTRKTLTFPEGTLAQQMMLKFEFHGTKFTRAAIRRYEIEWMPTPGPLRTYNFVVPVAENIELPDLTIRANAASVAATLFSCAGAGKPYVIQMPWPGQHTLSGIITITAPGGVVPSLRDYDIDESYAEIPIQIDAM